MIGGGAGGAGLGHIDEGDRGDWGAGLDYSQCDPGPGSCRQRGLTGFW